MAIITKHFPQTQNLLTFSFSQKVLPQNLIKDPTLKKVISCIFLLVSGILPTLVFLDLIASPIRYIQIQHKKIELLKKQQETRKKLFIGIGISLLTGMILGISIWKIFSRPSFPLPNPILPNILQHPQPVCLPRSGLFDVTNILSAPFFSAFVLSFCKSNTAACPNGAVAFWNEHGGKIH